MTAGMKVAKMALLKVVLKIGKKVEVSAESLEC